MIAAIGIDLPKVLDRNRKHTNTVILHSQKLLADSNTTYSNKTLLVKEQATTSHRYFGPDCSCLSIYCSARLCVYMYEQCVYIFRLICLSICLDFFPCTTQMLSVAQQWPFIRTLKVRVGDKRSVIRRKRKQRSNKKYNVTECVRNA